MPANERSPKVFGWVFYGFLQIYLKAIYFAE